MKRTVSVSSIDDGASLWKEEDCAQKKEIGEDSQRHFRGMNGGDLTRGLVDYQSQCTCRERRHQRQEHQQRNPIEPGNQDGENLIRTVPCWKIRVSLCLNPFGDTVDGARLIISGNLLTVVLEVLQNLCTIFDGADEH